MSSALPGCPKNLHDSAYSGYCNSPHPSQNQINCFNALQKQLKIELQKQILCFCHGKMCIFVYRFLFAIFLWKFHRKDRLNFDTILFLFFMSSLFVPSGFLEQVAKTKSNAIVFLIRPVYQWFVCFFRRQKTKKII